MILDYVLSVECDLKSFSCRRRFPIRQWCLGDFRDYIEQLVGIERKNLVIRFNGQEATVAYDEDLLGYVEGVEESAAVTIDSVCRVQDIDDVNRLPGKYQMSDDVYTQRKGTLKEYMKTNQLGKYSEKFSKQKSIIVRNFEAKRKLTERNQAKLKEMEIGMKVEVNEPISNRHYGEVAYMGNLRGIYDGFIGVIFDGAYGDCDGSYANVRYFEAKNKHASFIRPEYVDLVSAEIERNLGL